MPDLPFADIGRKWFEDIVDQITRWFANTLTEEYNSLTADLFATPVPGGSGASLVFGAPPPHDEPWHGIYQGVVGGEVMVLALLVVFLGVQARNFVRIFDFGFVQGSGRFSRSAWTGAVLVVGWYWIAVLVLYVVQGLTIGLLPDVGSLGAALVETQPEVVVNPLLTMLLAIIGAIALLLLEGVFYIREVLVFVFIYGMPIGIALATTGVPVVSSVARGLCRQFLPPAFLPLPAVVLFRGYSLLFTGDGIGLPSDPFLQSLIAISLPVLGVYVTWKMFAYASPAVSGVVGATSKAAVGLGVGGGLAYAGQTSAAATAMRSGTRAGLGRAAANSVGSTGSSNASRTDSGRPPGTSETTATTERTGNSSSTASDGGVPAYRRSENDPGYY